MPLAQLLITSANNNTLFVLPISGTCSMQILNIQYFDATAVNRIIQIQSDTLYFPYSPQKFITLLSPDVTNSIDNSIQSFNLKHQSFAGQMLLNVVQIFSSDASALPASFKCLLTLNIEHIDTQYCRKELSITDFNQLFKILLIIHLRH